MVELISLAVGMLLTGLVGGILAGLLGVGGGIVVVPMLEFALSVLGVDPGIRMHVAVATSLATIIPTSIASSRAHFKHEAVDLPLVKKWAPWMFIGALAGAWAASQLESTTLSGVFAVLALLVALRMIIPMRKRHSRGGIPSGIIGVSFPALTGFFSSMLGIGGGSLTVPTLTYFGQPIHRSIGTASLFGLLIAIPGTLGFMVTGWGNPLLPYGSIGYVNVVGLALISSATVLAAPLGAKLAHSISKQKLATLFGFFLFLISIRMLLRAFEA